MDDPLVIYLDLETEIYDDGSAAVFALTDDGVGRVVEYTPEQVAEIMEADE